MVMGRIDATSTASYRHRGGSELTSLHCLVFCTFLFKFADKELDIFHPVPCLKTMKRNSYNYLEAYVDGLRSKGRYTFTLAELHQQFDISAEALSKSLQRLIQKKEATRIRKEFYVVVPPEYRNRGVLPPLLFIADLMNFLNRDYYTGLLNAAAFYGAAHQQPQEFFVITTKPVLIPIRTQKLKINFCYKKHWREEDIIQRKTDTGYLNVSSPELTALDLIYYHPRIGGLNRATTVLQELAESIDAEKLVTTAKHYGQIATIQRLGFLLDEILGGKQLVRPLLTYLKTIPHYPVLLLTQKENPHTKGAGNGWKVIANTEIETDL